MSVLGDQLKKFLPAAGDTICQKFTKAAQFELEFVNWLKTIFTDANTFTDGFSDMFCASDVVTTTTTAEGTASTTTNSTTTDEEETTTSTTPPIHWVYIYNDQITGTFRCGGITQSYFIAMVRRGDVSTRYSRDLLTVAIRAQLQAQVNEQAEIVYSMLQAEGYRHCWEMDAGGNYYSGMTFTIEDVGGRRTDF